MIEPERIQQLNSHNCPPSASHVVYWMQAAQRARENHALGYAVERADSLGLPLQVVFILARYPGATAPHYRWMLSGLRECAEELRSAGIGFSIHQGEPVAVMAQIAKDAALVVCDRSPAWWAVSAKASLADRLSIPVIEVDGESVIPESVASPKQEWSARTFRLKVSGAIGLYASNSNPGVPCPKRAALGTAMPGDDALFGAYDDPAVAEYPGDRVQEQSFVQAPGSAAALKRFDYFLENGLDSYDTRRNDPMLDGTSGLSAYLHFGQISSLELVRKANAHGGPGVPAFVEQLVIRRELCRNYARYRPFDYDAWEGLPAWSRSTLQNAAADRRQYVYSRESWEASATHDRYWPARPVFGTVRSMVASGLRKKFDADAYAEAWGQTLCQSPVK